ncbi:MAG: hypothetical protein C5S45_04845 [Candidatus Methanocomedens sp.]|nr:MAG: hypothetical protein C5S45_04845 [ANME-2 cluster archaeon]
MVRMNYFNNIAINEKGQMMTIEAFLGALLIITAVLFVVSQAPSGVQQADGQSKTQLMHYGEDTIDMLKNSPPPEYTDYDNNLQYYFSEKKFDDLNEFLNDTLPDNVVYNVELYDGGRYLPIIRNGYPSANGISFNEIIITKGAPAGGVGQLTGTYITYKSFDNGSLIIPMDEKQNNNITAYNLILKISNLGIPVYQLLQDPRGNESAGFMNWSLPILTSTDPWNGSDEPDTRPYAGGPYVIDVADLTSILKNQIRGWAENPIEVPSSKIDMIEFNSSMEGKNIHITFTLNNGSTKIINLTAGTPNITSVDGLDSLNDSEYLHIDTTSVAYDDLNKSKIIGIVIFNQASFDLTISNITVESVGKKLSSITINGTNYPATQNKVKIDGGLTLAHDSPSEKVIIHNSSEEIKYSHTTWLTGSPRIAVYPEAGTMTNYFSDSGISYTVLDSNNIVNGNLGNYDILIVPHTEMIEDSLSDVIVVRNMIDWVSDGGVLLAECESIKEIDDRVEDVDQDNHTWHGFIGVQEYFNTSNTIQLVGRSPYGDTLAKYLTDNLTGNDGACFHPLAQSYTEDGILPGTDGTISAFRLNITGVNPKNSIMAVPQNESGGVAFPKITFIEAPFDKGTVIYLAGHDQSTFSQQRERLIFNSILYSTTAKVYSYGLLEIRITMWYK